MNEFTRQSRNATAALNKGTIVTNTFYVEVASFICEPYEGAELSESRRRSQMIKKDTPKNISFALHL